MKIIKVPVGFEPMIYGSKGKALTHCCYVNDVGKKKYNVFKIRIYTDEGNIYYINPWGTSIYCPKWRGGQYICSKGALGFHGINTNLLNKSILYIVT